MKKTSLVFVGVFLVFLVGCAALMEDQVAGIQPGSGIGGTGSPEYNGIGGTGKVAHSGIGGTGKIAQGPGGGGIGGTGIVGRVTAMGSIWVNGAHIDFDQETPVKRNNQADQKTEFKLGQVVAVLTAPRDKAPENRAAQGKGAPGKEYQAQRITIVHEVVGPVSRIEENHLWVLGQEVVVAKDVLQSVGQSALQPGTWLQVSGHRRQDQIIVASRLDIINNYDRVELIGDITNAEGQYRIGNQVIQLNSLIELDNQGDREFVSGHMESGVLVVEQLGEDPISELLEDAENLILEGFMLAAEDQFSLSGVDLMLPTAVDMQAIDTDMPIRINAALAEDVYEVDDVYILPDSDEYEYDYDAQDFMPLYESDDFDSQEHGVDDGIEYGDESFESEMGETEFDESGLEDEGSYIDEPVFDETEIDETEIDETEIDGSELDSSEIDVFDLDESVLESEFETMEFEEDMLDMEYEDSFHEEDFSNDEPVDLIGSDSQDLE